MGSDLGDGPEEKKRLFKKRMFKDSRLDSTKGTTFFTGEYQSEVNKVKNISTKTELEERLDAAGMYGGEKVSPLSGHSLGGAHNVDEGTFIGRHTTEWKERLRKYAHERHPEKELREYEENVSKREGRGKFAALIEQIKSDMGRGRSMMGLSMRGATQLGGGKQYHGIKHIRHRAKK